MNDPLTFQNLCVAMKYLGVHEMIYLKKSYEQFLLETEHTCTDDCHKVCWECMKEYCNDGTPDEGNTLDDGRELCADCLKDLED